MCVCERERASRRLGLTSCKMGNVNKWTNAFTFTSIVQQTGVRKCSRLPLSGRSARPSLPPSASERQGWF